jgi:1,4-alpha-glucan branching enzyme
MNANPHSRARLFDDGWLTPHFPAIRERHRRAQETGHRLTRGESLWDWAQGHKWFGLHREPGGTWVYRDWAPNATALMLVGDSNDWEEREEYQARRMNERGEWEVRLPAGALVPGQHYRVRMKWPGGGGERLPAWGRLMHQDAKTLEFSAVVTEAPEFLWKHAVPAPGAFLRVYEAHAGMSLEEARIGTWREFEEQMLPRIKAAGYDTIQLMAVMEHPYYGSFGYHVGSFFAPASRFGTPEELKSMVDAAHGLGLRVIMDLVHSHAVKNEVEGLSRYDGTLWQYFHDGPRGEHTAWDSRCFDYAKTPVLHFLLSNLRYWLEEFRFDGFRFDGVTSMLYQDHGLGKPFTSYDDYFGDNVDEEAVTYLALANQLIHEGAPGAVTIAEDVSGFPGLGALRTDHGLGFDYRLAMGVPDCWFKLAKDIRDDDWSMNWLWHELTNHRAEERAISYVESHDQALVGGKSFIFEMIDADMYTDMHAGSQNLRVERGVALHKLARLATMAAADGGYLNFMGNEFGHPEWIDFPREGNGWSCVKARRQWSLRDDPALRFKALGDFDAAVMQAPFSPQPPELLKADDGDKILAFRRGDAVIVLNFHPSRSYEEYGLAVAAGNYRFGFSTDEQRFGGWDRVAAGMYSTYGDGDHHWLRLYLPARTGVVLFFSGAPSESV